MEQGTIDNFRVIHRIPSYLDGRFPRGGRG